MEYTSVQKINFISRDTYFFYFSIQLFSQPRNTAQSGEMPATMRAATGFSQGKKKLISRITQRVYGVRGWVMCRDANILSLLVVNPEIIGVEGEGFPASHPKLSCLQIQIPLSSALAGGHCFFGSRRICGFREGLLLSLLYILFNWV